MNMKNNELMKLREQHIPQAVFNTSPIFVKTANGAVLTDVEGNEYIDFAGGIGVNNIGHSHPRVVEAIKEQAERFTHTCFHIGMYESYVELAKRLNEITPGDFDKMTLLANSGAEAVENAVKVARYATGRQGIICFENAFHGRTLLGMSLTSKVKPYKFNFGPMAPEIYRMPFAYCYRCPFGLKHPDCGIACADHLEDFFIDHVAPECTAAVIAEPIQGEGGFITPPLEYFPRLKKICEKYEIPLIIDEIQSGTGRTGTFLAIEQWGIEPDIITMAKSFAAGMPLSAVTGRKELMEKPHIGGLGGTYGGNPVACSAALAVLEVLFEEKLLEQSVELGKKLRSRFDDMQSKYEIIGDVRGLGPMLALELVKDRESKTPAAEEAKKLVKDCCDKGLIILSCGNYGNVIRTLMPFVITDDELEKGLGILEEGIATLSR